MMETAVVTESSPDIVKRALYELLQKGLKGVFRRDAVATALGEATLLHPEMPSVVVDVLALVDTETTTMGGSTKEERDRLVGIVKESEKYLSESVLKERMDIDTLGEAGVVKNSKKFFTSVIKTKTKLFYKQQKYNLFREETEGYAKLITELNQPDMAKRTSPKEVLRVIKSIIGYFNLDPNRVLDIILESFECQLEQHEFFVALLRDYTPDQHTLNELLGFKYKFYMEHNEKSLDDVAVPSSLYRQTALMIQHGILDLDSIYGLLGPEDEAIFGDADTEMSDAREFVRKMNIVSLKDKEAGDGKDGDKNKTAAAVDATEMDVMAENYKKNQKFGLLEALLEVGAWDHAQAVISRLPTYYAVCQVPIAKALAKLIHVSMQPVHQKYSGLSPRIRSTKYPPLNNKGAPKPAEDFEEFKETVVPMLQALGPYAVDDPVLLFKVLRVLKHASGISGNDSGKEREKSVEPIDPASSQLYHEALTLMDEVFLPALALSDGNCCLAEELWTILRVYPYNCRYRLYGSWKSDTYAIHPPLMRKRVEVQKKAKAIMQRISKENVKPTSRKIGKVTNSSPGLMFDYILSQIQLYDNLIGPVVDSFKYLTSLSFDVLSYSIIEALNNPEKDRTKHDGTSISLWLQSLSNFCGAVYKKYNIDLTGILQYVANQLKNQRSLDLLILKEIVLKMSGIEASEEMTNEQIDAMAGGDLLKQEASSFNQIKNTRKSSQRLKDALIDNKLAVPICLLMAQQRNCVVYQETEDSHLKLVGKLFDQCQDTLVQFGSFLASNLSVDDYAHRLPEMGELLTRYHVNSDLAFFLARPMFNHKIALKFDEFRRSDKSWKGKTDSEKQEVHVKAAMDVMEPVTAAIRPLHPTKTWDDISPQFLATFWSLTMYDLFVPDAIYEREVGKQRLIPAKIDENRDFNSARKKKEKERITAMIDKLQDEQRKQQDHVNNVMARLKEEKDTWFFSRSAKLAKNETITTFLQLCLFPRCIFTSTDAIFCAKFVSIIHSLKTPNFSTLICFDRIFCDITYTVTSCTENEAQRYGRFLAAMLETANRWHSSKEIFEEECVGYPGFVTKFRVQTPNSGDNPAQNKGDDHVDFENYRHVCHKWHYKIAKALVVCLESKDYVQIRNALTVLTKILPFFPVIQNLSNVIEKRIEKVCAEEKEARKDLYIKAMSYSGQLKVRKSSMFKEHEFHKTKDTSKENGSASAKPAATSAETTSPSAKKSKADSLARDSSSRDRESKSRERSSSKTPAGEARRSRDRDLRQSRERSEDPKEKSSKTSREKMPPPTAGGGTTEGGERRRGGSPARRSKEPSEERETKRRKVEDEDERKDRKRVSESSRGVDKKDDLRRDMKKDRKRTDEESQSNGSSSSKRGRGIDDLDKATNGSSEGGKGPVRVRKTESSSSSSKSARK